ncbi:MAG: hypothetical protein KAG92_00620, partial [Deltaproteobacteria bacterium]|nr:hypothetical protein [Deltaproteobacteria bacterium]
NFLRREIKEISNFQLVSKKETSLKLSILPRIAAYLNKSFHRTFSASLQKSGEFKRSAVDIFVSMAKLSSLIPSLHAVPEKGVFHCGCTKNMETNKGAL